MLTVEEGHPTSDPLYDWEVPSESQLARKQPVFAVVRVDRFHSDAVALANRITIKEILPTIEEADAEVARLQRLRPSSDIEYFVAGGNWFPDGRGVQIEY